MARKNSPYLSTHSPTTRPCWSGISRGWSSWWRRAPAVGRRGQLAPLPWPHFLKDNHEKRNEKCQPGLFENPQANAVRFGIKVNYMEFQNNCIMMMDNKDTMLLFTTWPDTSVIRNQTDLLLVFWIDTASLKPSCTERPFNLIWITNSLSIINFI